MKKYRVTEKHPAYKEGLEIIDNVLILSNADNWNGIFPETRKQWLEDGWIKEIQEPEFTREDMINFAKWCEDALNDHLGSSDSDVFALDENIDEWKNEKK